MHKHIFKYHVVLIFLLGLTSSQAQTLSTCRPSPPLPQNPKPGVNSLAFTKDGKTLVVAGSDGKIRLLDAASGSVQRTFSGHTNAVYIAVFSPDEKLLASSSRDLTARIWDVASGRELHKFTGFRCAVKTVAFSPDGRTVAASGNDGMIKLWDMKTENELGSLVHINSADVDMSVYSVAFDQWARRYTERMVMARLASGTLLNEKRHACGRRTMGMLIEYSSIAITRCLRHPATMLK